MANSHPKAFISHNSQDRTFVERFSTDLRVNGVDAWYSGWEISPGDSIRAKLDEGLTECDIFIIVLSRESIDRPWVQTELDAATVRKLDGKVKKIIPIKIEKCGELPPTLGSLLWEDFSDKTYDVAFKGVLNSIFSVATKPPLGRIPDLPPIVVSRTQQISTTATIFWTAMALAALLIASKLTLNLGIPPFVGQVVAGIVLAGIVWKFFERVEAVLTDGTKSEITGWLLGVEVGKKIEPWPDTFAKLFDRIFGARHLSWKCFARSCMTSMLCGIVAWYVALTQFWPYARIHYGVWGFLFLAAIFVPVVNVLPDYVSLLKTRYLLQRLRLAKNLSSKIAILFVDCFMALGISVVVLSVAGWREIQGYFDMKEEVHRIVNLPQDQYIAALHSFRNSMMAEEQPSVVNDMATAIEGGHGGDVFRQELYTFKAEFLHFGVILVIGVVLPAFFASLWLWFYLCSGLFIKAARRFDIGFECFNQHMDIEKKPLQSIGLVSCCIVAVGYWSIALLHSVL